MGIGAEPAPAVAEPEHAQPEHAQPAKAQTATGRHLLGRRHMPEKPVEPALPPGPMTISTFQKMKEQGYYRQQYFKDVECFSCPNKFKVGRSAKSTQCPACGVPISLEDIDINVASTQSILTRGDVLIRKNGNVSASQIKCRDLKVFGMVSGQLECSGDLVFRTSGTIIGEIRCKRLIVEKGSDLHFHNVIYADDVELQARVSGNVQCSGRVLIGALGWIHGDVTARSVSIEPGGQLDGAMNILRTTSSAQPLPLLATGSPIDATPVSGSGAA
jgi:cytoskeletal protein CcmA (bactofilin family)